MLSWRNGDSEGYTDLANDLWVWFLDRPGTQLKLEGLNNFEMVKTLKPIATQILSEQQGKMNVFRQLVVYSSDNVKDALKGSSTNWALIELLPEAIKSLEGRNKGYSDAIESRYRLGKVPQENAPKQRLKHAVRSLTEIVNALCISGTKRDENDKLTVKDGPGSAAGKFGQDREAEAPPPARRGKGEHSDPTANAALSKVRAEDIYLDSLDVAPLAEFTQRPRQVIVLPDGRRYRLTSREQREVAADPRKVFEVIESVLERAC